MSLFADAVGQAFLNVMRARHPEYTWRLVSEDERAQADDATAGQISGPLAAEQHTDTVADRGTAAA